MMKGEKRERHVYTHVQEMRLSHVDSGESGLHCTNTPKPFVTPS